jgi:hypothetical protein
MNRSPPTLQELALGFQYQLPARSRFSDTVCDSVDPARTPRTGERRSQVRLSSQVPKMNFLPGSNPQAGFVTCGIRLTRRFRAA